MIKEMGSEFWQIQKKSDERLSDEVIVLSGRTALDLIIRDLKLTKKFKSIMLPSYCCDSMIEPFTRNGIEVSFYLVTEEGIDYPQNNKDAVLLLDYFGYIDEKVTRIASQSKRNGQIIIYDSTHYLGNREIEADYVLCSFRKWFFCNFAIVKKMNGYWSVAAPKEKNECYITLRNEAAVLKEKYIKGDFIDKKVFLKMFTEAEENLENDYLNYAGNKVVYNEELIVDRRRNNAQRLVDGIQSIKELSVWKKQIGEKDTPLVVPILVASEIRNELRKYLIDSKIYCSVHWPVTYFHGNNRNIYDNELSLVCDQRYASDDIDREIEVIKDFFKRRKISGIKSNHN